MNIGTAIVLLLVLALIFFSIRSIARKRKSGGCSGCPYSSSCHGGCSAEKAMDSILKAQKALEK